MEFSQTENRSNNKSKHDEEGHSSDLEKKRIRVTPFIPVLCIVDVFLSSHFTPFRGHFAPPPPINESLKKDKAEGKAWGIVVGNHHPKLKHSPKHRHRLKL